MKSRISWLLGIWGCLYCQGLMGVMGSWLELREHQDGAKRCWAPVRILGVLRKNLVSLNFLGIVLGVGPCDRPLE